MATKKTRIQVLLASETLTHVQHIVEETGLSLSRVCSMLVRDGLRSRGYLSPTSPTANQQSVQRIETLSDPDLDETPRNPAELREALDLQLELDDRERELAELREENRELQKALVKTINSKS